MKILQENEITQLIEKSKYKIIDQVTTNDSELEKYLLLVKFLYSEEINQLIENKDITKEQALYSQYFWLLQYKKVSKKLYGYDAGLEQQEFKLIEHISRELAEHIDWDLLERIDKGIETSNDIGQLLFEINNS